MNANGKRPVWGWFIGTLAILLFMYVLSFGPACKLVEQRLVSSQPVSALYHPLIRIGWSGPEWLRNAIFGYTRLWRAGFVYTELATIDHLETRSSWILPYIDSAPGWPRNAPSE